MLRMKHLLLSIIIVSLVGILIIPNAFAIKMDTDLSLDPIPDTLKTTVVNEDGIPSASVTISVKLTHLIWF